LRRWRGRRRNTERAHIRALGEFFAFYGGFRLCSALIADVRLAVNGAT
jgi:hypothetical protein